VAKLRSCGRLDFERTIHEAVLPDLGLATPAFLGFASGAAGGQDVLFLEDVGLTAFQPTDPAHRDAAARWLGGCHGASAGATIPALVPRKGLDDELSMLSAARIRLGSMRDSPDLGAEGGSLVARVVHLLELANDRWSEWSECTASVPMVLTHGTFLTRNVRMRGTPEGLTTFPFDWDHAAVRSPAIDLARTPGGNRGFAANASLARYGGALASSGVVLGDDVIGVLSVRGTVVRAAACIKSLRRLEGDDLRQPLAELEVYRRALAGALQPSLAVAGRP
jgi:hypothetical protein